MSYRAVIFDLGGVVLQSPLRIILRFERERGLPEGTVGRVIVSGGPDGTWAQLERGEISLEQFYQALDADAAAAGTPFSAAELLGAFDQMATVRPEMIDVIRGLRARDLKTAALTNNWVSRNQWYRLMGELQAEFDVFVESCKVGLRKPDPRIYELVLDELGVPAPDSIFLDDLGTNLKPARAMGMATIKVEDPNEALAELERLLSS